MTDTLLTLAALVAFALAAAPARAQPTDDAAATYAAMYGVPLTEAQRRLDAQAQTGRLNALLERGAAGTFAGMYAEHVPAYRVVARFTSPPDAALLRLIDGMGLADVVEVESAAVPYADLLALVPRALAAARAAGVAADAAVDVVGGAVVLAVLDRAPLDAALRDGRVRLPERVRVEVVDGLVRADAARPLPDTRRRPDADGGPPSAPRPHCALDMPLRPAVLALAALAACASPDGTAPTGPHAAPADSDAVTVADPPLLGTWWRLVSLGGDAPVEGVRPVLVFTDEPALRDAYGRPYPDRFAGWRVVTGDLGVGHLHAPYRRAGDSLRVVEAYDYTRLSTDAEIAQARRLANALDLGRTMALDGTRLAVLDARGDTLAVFAADPPRPPAPLDDVEWVLDALGPDVRPVPDGVRADLTFTSERLGPGEDDGFDRVHGYSGCNWYGGGYRLAADGPGRFRLDTSGPPMATQRGCPERVAGVEGAVLGALYRAAVVETSRDGRPTADAPTALALRDSSGALLLRFRRHEPHPVDLGALRTSRWRFASTENPDAPPLDDLLLTFSDSMVEARRGCFRLRGRYTVDGDDLTIHESAADDTGCPADLPPERRYVPLGSGKVSVTPDRLVLYNEDGAATAFAR